MYPFSKYKRDCPVRRLIVINRNKATGTAFTRETSANAVLLCVRFIILSLFHLIHKYRLSHLCPRSNDIYTHSTNQLFCVNALTHQKQARNILILSKSNNFTNTHKNELNI